MDKQQNTQQPEPVNRQMLAALKRLLHKAYKQNWQDNYPSEVECAEAAITAAEAAQPVGQQAEHNLTDVRCECCGYLTHQREHMGCIRAAHSSAVDVPDVLEQLQLAETEVTNAKAWSAGEEAKTHCRHALTAIAVVRSLLSAAQKH